ncbi:MAG: Lrp/AsnC family transcriptional regulator [Pyrodictiaceae archaeon]
MILGSKVELDEEAKEILMELQYSFPLTTTPFKDIAERLGMSTERLIKKVKDLMAKGIIKRIGFYVNYKSIKKEAALVGMNVDAERLNKLVQLQIRDPDITHSFLREHPEYNVWFVVKKEDKTEIMNYVVRLAKTLDTTKWIILFSERSYKLSVKYDLYRGISRSGKYALLPESIPSITSLGVSKSFIHMLRRIPVTVNPYKEIAKTHGLTEEQVVALAKRLLSVGVLCDPGASLNGSLLGFNANALLMLEPNEDNANSLCHCIANSPYTTHVVRRTPHRPEWKYTCYAMIHAVSREKALSAAEEIISACSPRDVQIAFSQLDLKPGVIR